ncbi:hypothetical protein BDU57DRAFT_512223 [Ampelomyces quisqualis]|uniref:Uncharacterized protein n=1 Tax=Ampelomyces quisqualis TaxID=50730 RepID=A0A6A5QV42_AMPQU|nr:hypothetical protein BDU57DRAFT_512223 [Ampelomyces quisqualis]
MILAGHGTPMALNLDMLVHLIVWLANQLPARLPLQHLDVNTKSKPTECWNSCLPVQSITNIHENVPTYIQTADVLCQGGADVLGCAFSQVPQPQQPLARDVMSASSFHHMHVCSSSTLLVHTHTHINKPGGAI